MVKNADSEGRLAEFKSWLHLLPAVRHWISYLTFLSFQFSFCKLELLTPCCYKDEILREVLTTVPGLLWTLSFAKSTMATLGLQNRLIKNSPPWDFSVRMTRMRNTRGNDCQRAHNVPQVEGLLGPLMPRCHQSLCPASAERADRGLQIRKPGSAWRSEQGRWARHQPHDCWWSGWQLQNKQNCVQRLSEHMGLSFYK